MKGSFINSAKSLGVEIIPKKYLIDENFWFVNAGLLSDSIYNRAVLFIGTFPFNIRDFNFVLFLGIKYLIHYIELFTFDNTPLLIECIMKHLRYLQALLGTQRKSKKFLNYGFIIKLQYIFNDLQNVDDRNFACRQMYIDQLERFCNLFVGRLNIWIKNPRLQAYLFRYGYDPFRSSVIYNSFLIPNQKRYVDPLCRLDQKFIEKIEVKCNCKIMLSVENTDCILFPEYITLEVVFDLYRGNYVGFIEMFGYIVKRLNPTQYFAKSLRTVLIEGSLLYNILTNVPIRKLKYLEKTVTAGCPITPFLSVGSISKQLLSIVAIMRENDNDFINNRMKETLSDFSEENSKEVDLNFDKQRYYTSHSTVSEFNKLQDNINDINYSQKLLKYFKSKYDIVMQEINFENEIKKENIRKLITSQENSQILMPKVTVNETRSDKPETVNQIVYKDLPEGFVESSNNFKNEVLSFDKENMNYLNTLKDIPKTKEFLNNNINENNICAIHKELLNDSDIDFEKLEPIDQFKLLLKETFTDYSIEENWINHKMRLMMKCNTESTIDDSKYPYVYQKASIRDRLNKKIHYRSKFPLPRGVSRTFSTHKAQTKITNQTSRRSWISKAASRLLSEGIKSHDDADSYNSSLSDSDILSGEELKEKFPKIFLFLEKYGENLIDVFLRKKLYKKQDWMIFLSKQFNFTISKDLSLKRLCDFDSIFKAICEKNSEKLENFDEAITKKIYALLLLLTDEMITHKEFSDIYNGKGVSLLIINKVNQSQTSVPTHIGNLDSYKSKDYLPNLSRCLCQMMYDLIQIAHESSQDAFYILKIHISMLDDILKNIQDKDILAAFEILNIRKSLLSLDFKTYIRCYGLDGSMILMAEELSFLHDIIFKQPCCSYKLNKHLGLHIIYHSLKLDDRLNTVEPFFKLPGDRRIRKIEKICNCLIALRSQKHPTVPINEYLVDIFYDFDTGNHFGAIDLLKQLITSTNKLLTIQDHRTIVAYPSGELWVFRDTVWLKKCYNINENELKNLELFRKFDEMKDKFHNFYDDKYT